MARDVIKLHFQPLILKVAGQVPTVPNPPTALPGDATWNEETDILIGQTAYNVIDNRVYIRNGNEIMPYKSTMYYRHTQPTPATEWTVEHKLGFRPAITIVDEFDNEVEAEVIHDNDFKVTIKFTKPFAGKVYCT
jgi:hypothetical protein